MLYNSLFAICVVLALAGCKKDQETPGRQEAKQDTTAPTDNTAAADAKADPDGSERTVEQGHKQLEDNAAKAIPTIDKGNNVPAKKSDVAAKAPTSAQKLIADTDTYRIVIQLPEASAGKQATAKLVVTPKPGWKLNREFPTKLTIEPPSGVTVAQAKQKVPDALAFQEKKGATWGVSFTADAVGQKSFTGKFKFAVCTDATCDPKSEALAFAVVVK